MCLSNISNQAEYLNLVSNMENEDKATPEGMAELDAALAKLAKINLAKIEMFDDLVSHLEGYWISSCLEGRASHSVDVLLSNARKLLRGELP